MQLVGHDGLWSGMTILAACHLPAALAAGLLSAGAKAVLCPSLPAGSQVPHVRPGFLCAMVEALSAGHSLLDALQGAGEHPFLELSLWRALLQVWQAWYLGCCAGEQQPDAGGEYECSFLVAEETVLLKGLPAQQ